MRAIPGVVQPPSKAAAGVAILYVIVGGIGMVPGLFLLAAIVLGGLFWYFIMRVAQPPITLEMLLSGATQSTLQAWPQIPFGALGMCVLAIHFLAAIPAPMRATAVLGGKPGAERALRRLGAAYLLVFPIGTLLGIAALALLGRAPAQALPARPSPSAEDRVLAAVCYGLPLVGALYVFVRGPASAFLRMHAVQSSLAGMALYLLAAGTRAADPMLGYTLLPVVTLGAVLAIATLAFLAYAGVAFSIPGIGPLAERMAARFAGAQEAMREAVTLGVHRRNLLASPVPAPRTVLPKIAGERTGSGFEQRADPADAAALAIMAGVLALMLLLLAAGGWRRIASSGLSAVVVVTLVFFGGAILFAIYLFVRRAMSGAATGALVVRPWPVKPGAEVRLQYKARPPLGGKAEAVDAGLRCLESMYWRDSKNNARQAGVVVHDIVAAPVRPHAFADGSVVADWSMRIPEEAPPSFEAQGGSIRWMLTVETRLAGAPDGRQEFELLVVPPEAA